MFSENADRDADDIDDSKSFNIYNGNQVLKLLRRVSKKLKIQTLEHVLILEDILVGKPFNFLDLNQVEKWLIKEYKKKKLLNLLSSGKKE